MAVESSLESKNHHPLTVDGGILNKDALNYDAELNRLQDDNNGANDEDLEEGEILDSAEGENKTSNGMKKKKKKRKRKKKLNDSNNANTERVQPPSKKPKKSAKYVDHDKCEDDLFGQKPKLFPSPRKRRHKSGDHQVSPKKSSNGARSVWEIDAEGHHPHGSQKAKKNFNFMEEDNYQSEELFSDEMGETGPKRRKVTHHKSKRKKISGPGDRRRSKSKKVVNESKLKKLECRFFLEGKCFKGDECTYRHDGCPSKKPELCKFYLNGFCRNGSSCIFMHEEFPCKFFHTGATCYSNENCRFSHEPLTDETRKMLAKCLDSGKLPDDLQGNDEDDNDDNVDDGDIQCDDRLHEGKRPILLGSPPPKHGDDQAKREGFKYRPKLSNFYSSLLEEINDYGEVTPVNSDGQDDSWDGEKSEQGDAQRESKPQIDIKVSEEEKCPPTAPKSSDEVNDGDIDSKQDSPLQQSIPTHLPKKQRELFLRIQQQQREVEVEQEADNKDDNQHNEENWYSDDEEEEGDQPLTAVLKKIQQSEPETAQKAHQNATKAPAFDIASMISAIKNQSCLQSRSDQSSDDDKSSQNTPNRIVPRDPRLTREASNEKRSPSMHASHQKLPGKDDYFLVKMEVSVPGDYNKFAIASARDSVLKVDPRIQKLINKFGNIDKIIMEEERKNMPKLADFVPPPITRSEVMPNDKKVLPNYFKNLDPRASRRPSLLSGPMADANGNQKNSRFSNPMNTSPARMPSDFQENSSRGDWSPMNCEPNFMNNQQFNPRINVPRPPIRGNFHSPIQNPNVRNMPSPDAARSVMGTDIPFQSAIQNTIRMNRIPHANMLPNRGPRGVPGPMSRDPRIDSLSSRGPRMETSPIRDPRMDSLSNRNTGMELSPVRDPRMDASPGSELHSESCLHDPRATKMDSRDPRTTPKADTDMRQLNFLNLNQNISSALGSRDPRQKGMNQILNSNFEQSSLPPLNSQNLKSAFKTIDRTMPPFC